MTRTVHTYCRICEPACGLLAEVEDGRIRLSPDREHPVHKGFCCHKGLSFAEVHEDPDRLDFPLRRSNSRSDAEGRFERTTWDEAMSEIGERLLAIRAEHGPGAIATYQGNPMAFESRAFPAYAGFLAKLGTDKTFSAGTQDCSNKVACNEQVYGTGFMHPIPDLEHTDYLLSIGCNPRVSHMSFVHTTDPMQLIKGIVARGGKVRFVNPRRIESSTPATGEVLLIKPDTDVYFLAAVLQEIHATVGFDPAFVAAHAKNIDGLVEFVAQYPPERVEGVTGLSAAEIRTVAREFCAAGAASVHMSTGANQGRQGTLVYWLVQMLAAVTGNLGRRGGNVYSAGFFPTAPSGAVGPESPMFEGPLGPVRHCTGALPGNLFADYVAQEQEPIRALLVFSGNPLLSMAAEDRVREALRKLELVVSVDLYRNATGELADFILPATDWLEREDVNTLGAGYQTHPYLQHTEAVVAPKAERRDDWWIFARLEQALGLPSALDAEGSDSWAVLNEMLEASGLSVEALKQQPNGTVVLPPPNPDDVFGVGLQTPDRRIDCCPTLFRDGIQRCAELFSELENESEDVLKLVSRRTTHMHNSWLHNMPGLKRGAHLANPLYMNPDDAATRSLDDGVRVRVHNDFGSIEANVKLDDTLRRGVVAMTHGWGNGKTPGMRVARDHPGANANRLLPAGPGSYETLSNMAFMNGVPVRVQPCG